MRKRSVGRSVGRMDGHCLDALEDLLPVFATALDPSAVDVTRASRTEPPFSLRYSIFTSHAVAWFIFAKSSRVLYV